MGFTDVINPIVIGAPYPPCLNCPSKIVFSDQKPRALTLNFHVGPFSGSHGPPFPNRVSYMGKSINPKDWQVGSKSLGDVYRFSSLFFRATFVLRWWNGKFLRGKPWIAGPWTDESLQRMWFGFSQGFRWERWPFDGMGISEKPLRFP